MAVQVDDTASAVRFLSCAPESATLATGYTPLWVGDALFFIDIRGRLQRWNCDGVATIAHPAAGPLWFDEEADCLLFRLRAGDSDSAWAIDPSTLATTVPLNARDESTARYREFAEYGGLSRAFANRSPAGATLALQVLTESGVRLMLVIYADGRRDILELRPDGELTSRGAWCEQASDYDFTRDAEGDGYLLFPVPGKRRAWAAGASLEVRHVRGNGTTTRDEVPYASWAAYGDFKIFDLSSGGRLIATNVGYAPGTVALRGLWQFDGEAYRHLFLGSLDVDWSRRSGSGRFIAFAVREADPPPGRDPATLLIVDSAHLQDAQGDGHA